MSRNLQHALAALVCASLLVFSCASGPRPPEKGTPAFYWQAARETFASGDYLKTTEHLEALMRTQGEYVAQARPWRLVMLAGLMRAHDDLAEQMQAGARNNKADPAPFRRSMSDNRSIASRFALQLGEAYTEFEKVQPSGDVILAFPYPSRGSTGIPPAVLKAAQGVPTPDSEAEAMRTAMVQRGVIQATCAAAGAPGDAPKAAQILKTPPVPVNRAAFEAAMAKSLFDAAMLYGPMKLDIPDRRNLLLQEAQGAVKQAAPGKETEELKAQINKELKNQRGRS